MEVFNIRKHFLILWIIIIIWALIGCTKVSVPITVIPKDDNKQEIIDENKQRLDNQNNQAVDNQSRIERLEASNGVACSEFPHIEVSGEKMNFLGKSYEEFSSPLLERIMAKAVRFYIAAYIDDIEYLKILANTELMAELEKALSETKETSYNYGGNQVVSLKKSTKYKKPYFITAPQKIEENIYLVELNDLDKSNVFKVTLSINSSDEIKVNSFFVKAN